MERPVSPAAQTTGTSNNWDLWIRRDERAAHLEREGALASAASLYEDNIEEQCTVFRTYFRLANLYHQHSDYDEEVRVLEQAMSVFWQWPKQAKRFSKLLARAEHHCAEYPDRDPDPIVDKQLEEEAIPPGPEQEYAPACVKPSTRSIVGWVALLCLLLVGSLWMLSEGRPSDQRIRQRIGRLPDLTSSRADVRAAVSGKNRERTLSARMRKPPVQRYTAPGLSTGGRTPGLRIYPAGHESLLEELWRWIQGGRRPPGNAQASDSTDTAHVSYQQFKQVKNRIR